MENTTKNYQVALRILDSALERAHGSVIELYELLNRPCSRTNFYRAFDKRDRRLPIAKDFCDWLDMLGARIVEKDEDLPFYVSVPIVKAIAGAGSSLECSGDIKDIFVFESSFFTSLGVPRKKAIMMKIRGDSMSPLFASGGLVLINTQEIEPADGEIFVLSLGEELLVKRLQKIPGGWEICSENPRYRSIPVTGQSLEEIRIHGRVRWYSHTIGC